MKYYYWFPPCIFAEWPWHLNIHKPLKIKEAHLVHLACCYAQQRLQSVQSKILSHSEVKWELFSKQQNTISFPHARRWLSVDKYLTSALLLFGEWHFSSDIARCIPFQRRFGIWGKQKQGSIDIFLTVQRENWAQCGILRWIGEWKKVSFGICALLLWRMWIVHFPFYPITIMNWTVFPRHLIFSNSGELLWCLSLQASVWIPPHHLEKLCIGCDAPCWIPAGSEQCSGMQPKSNHLTQV